MKIARYIVVIVLIFFIYFNLKTTTGIITIVHKMVTAPEVLPGSPFLFLKPFLVHVYRAGYYSDYTPLNPDVDPDYAYSFQSAQSVLAPTILDHENPDKYDYVVIVMTRPQELGPILKRWPLSVYIYNGYNILAIHRLRR
jgi:hypothetical protein